MGAQSLAGEYSHGQIEPEHLLLAAWAVIRAAETGRLRWLLLCAALVGLGFNVKMLQAFLVLPAFYLLYLVAAPVRWWKRPLHLALATVALLGVSLAWVVAGCHDCSIAARLSHPNGKSLSCQSQHLPPVR